MDNDERAAILKAELDAGHPVTGAYDANDFIATGQCNAVNIVRDRKSMTGREVREATNPAEYNVLSADQQSNWIAFTQPTNVLNPKTGGIDEAIAIGIFGGGSATITALAVARSETVSQMEILGLGTSIKEGSVQNARAL